MPPKNIVIGQAVTPAQIQQAKELRRQMTPAERMLWQHLRANRLDGWHFRRQQIIAGFIVDFYCHAAALAIEVDGPVHESQAGYDQERDRILADHSVRVKRFQNHEILENLEAVLLSIRLACRN